MHFGRNIPFEELCCCQRLLPTIVERCRVDQHFIRERIKARVRANVSRDFIGDLSAHVHANNERKLVKVLPRLGALHPFTDAPVIFGESA